MNNIKIKIIIFLLCVPKLAFAYIDPGNGAYFIQIIIVFVGSFIFYISHPVQLIKWISAKWHAFKQRLKKAKF